MSTIFSRTVGSFYDALAEAHPDPAVRFLNYGFEDPEASGGGWLAPEDEPYRVHLNLVRHLLRGVDLEDRTVVEVSSGRGGNCHYVASYTPARSVLGIDRCFGNVRLARSRTTRAGVSFLVGEAEDLSIRSGSIDVVLSLEAAHCYGRFGRFLAEVRRILKPGGVLCFTDLWGLDLPGVDWERRERAIDEAGFTVTRAEDLRLGVLRALEHEHEGVFRFHASTQETGRSRLRGRIAEVAREVRTQLAAGVCTYPLRHLRKPLEASRS